MSGVAGYDEENLSRARAATRNGLGAEAESKASDAFCAAFALTSEPAVAAGFEAFSARSSAAPAPGIRAVVELAPPSEAETETLPTEVPAAAAEKVREVLAEIAPHVHGSEKALALLLRQAAIRSERDLFYSTVGAVRDELERATHALPQAAPHAAPVGITASSVQACWLNRTIRAETAAGAVAAIAGDPLVHRLDV
ncbi:MAG: hypothetical protein M3389_14190, partial [Actinomycetota bacterium]|nr:hypothetical protein [Actinomycetota bacterium]